MALDSSPWAAVLLPGDRQGILHRYSKGKAGAGPARRAYMPRAALYISSTASSSAMSSLSRLRILTIWRRHLAS